MGAHIKYFVEHDGQPIACLAFGSAARRLPADWQRLYAYRPLLLETFVDVERHAGTCYRAANWLHVGHTKGRGRMDRHFHAGRPRKAILLSPLVEDAAHRLRRR